MGGRDFSSASYRYGFNDKESDGEMKGNRDSYDYGFRIYDPRLGKFMTVDPLTKKYPELTPYQFASNCPIQNIDLDGLEGTPSTTKPNGTQTTARSSVFVNIPVPVIKPMSDQALVARINRTLKRLHEKEISFGDALKMVDQAVAEYLSSNLVMYGSGGSQDNGTKRIDLQKIKGHLTVLDINEAAALFKIMYDTGKAKKGAPKKESKDAVAESREKSLKEARKEMFDGKQPEEDEDKTNKFKDTLDYIIFLSKELGDTVEIFRKNSLSSEKAHYHKGDKEYNEAQNQIKGKKTTTP
jgi:RHS repeat-associated protein